MAPESPPHGRGGGLAAGLVAFSLWGALPVYWKLLKSVPSLTVLAHRVVWSCVVTACLLTVRSEWKAVAFAMQERRTRWRLAASSVLIGTNWLLYVWAISHDHAVDCSLGYFVTPIMTVLLGVVFLSEELSAVEKLSLVVICGAVGGLFLAHPVTPAIALGLAVSFSFYSLFRKTTGVPAFPAFFIECLFLSAPAILFLALAPPRDYSPLVTCLLVGSGVATAVPMVLFNVAARSLPLTTLGMVQYVNPTGQLLVAVAVFHETVSGSVLVAFAAIWSALIAYVWARR